MKPFRILQTETQPEAVEALVHQMNLIGAAAVYSDETDGKSSVHACFPLSDNLETRLQQTRQALRRLQECGLNILPAKISFKTFRNSDWTNWRSYFKPQAFGETLLILPSWEPMPPNPPKAVVRLDPGMAFGTGQHESTRLCLQTLAGARLNGKAVLDIGAGSGILAAAAAKLGAERVLAVDNDPKTVPTARQNARANNVQDRVRFQHATPKQIRGTFDILLMNILAEAVVQELPNLKPLLKPGGWALFSGFMEDETPGVIDALRAAAWTPFNTTEMNNWNAVQAKAHQKEERA